MHEVFLCRLAHHPVFRLDHNFRVFLEYEQDLAVKTKNKMELIGVGIIYLYTSSSIYDHLLNLYSLIIGQKTSLKTRVNK